MKRGSARTAASNARSAAVFASSGRDRPGARDATAPQDVVGDDERARREASGERLEVGPVFGLERVDEDEVERAVEGRLAGRERLERRCVDDRDPLVGDARLAPPAAGEIGPLAVRVDRHDRAVGAAGRAPATASSSRTRSRPRRSVAGRRRGPAAPARCRGRRSGCRAARRRLDRRQRGWQRRRQRFDPVEVDAVGDPGFGRSSPSGPHTSSPAPK